jgi:anti-sigma B factor antagonist
MRDSPGYQRTGNMELTSQQLDSGILRINLAGRMDNAGTQKIDQQFSALTAADKAFVLVDIAAVTILASVGIRTLVSNAKALQRRGGALVLFRPSGLVEDVLKSTEIDTIIPIFHDLDDASRTLLAS